MEPLLIREMKALADDFQEGDLSDKLSVVQRAIENLEIMRGAKVDKETREMTQLLLPLVIALEWTVESLRKYVEQVEHIKAEINGLEKRLATS